MTLKKGEGNVLFYFIFHAVEKCTHEEGEKIKTETHC